MQELSQPSRDFALLLVPGLGVLVSVMGAVKRHQNSLGEKLAGLVDLGVSLLASLPTRSRGADPKGPNHKPGARLLAGMTGAAATGPLFPDLGTGRVWSSAGVQQPAFGCCRLGHPLWYVSAPVC
jgi:hypothetical protein